MLPHGSFPLARKEMVHDLYDCCKDEVFINEVWQDAHGVRGDGPALHNSCVWPGSSGPYRIAWRRPRIPHVDEQHCPDVPAELPGRLVLNSVAVSSVTPLIRKIICSHPWLANLILCCGVSAIQ